MSSKLLPFASSPFVQTIRLLSRRAKFHYPLPPIIFLFPHGRSQPPTGLLENPCSRLSTLHGEHNLSPLRRNPNTRPLPSLPAAQTTAQALSHSLAMAGSSSLPATRFLLLLLRLSQVPAQRPGPSPPRGRHAGAPHPRAPHEGPDPHPRRSPGNPLPYPRPAPHPFPPPPLLPPGLGKRVQARTRGPCRYDKTPALRGGWEGGREGRGGSASLTLSWSHRTLLRFSSGARFLSRPISSSRSWAADIIVSSWPNPLSPNAGCSSAAAAAASPPRPTAPPPPRVTETKWRHDSSPCPQCSARLLTASGAWRSAGRARRRPGVGGGRRAPRPPGACRSRVPAEAATAPGSTWRRGKTGTGLVPFPRPGLGVPSRARPPRGLDGRGGTGTGR